MNNEHFHGIYPDFAITDGARRAYEQHVAKMRQKEQENKRLMSGQISEDKAIDLKDASLTKEEFMQHVKNDRITSITVVAVFRDDSARDTGPDYGFAGAFARRPVYATYSFSFSGDEYRKVYIVNNHLSAENIKAKEENEFPTYEAAEELRQAFPELSIRIKKQNGEDIDEEKMKAIQKRKKRYQEQLEGLPPAPQRMEYKEFIGYPVLFPKADGPIVAGTEFTLTQIRVAQELLFVKEAHPLTLFKGYLEKREKMIREGYPNIADFVDRG